MIWRKKGSVSAFSACSASSGCISLFPPANRVPLIVGSGFWCPPPASPAAPPQLSAPDHCFGGWPKLGCEVVTSLDSSLLAPRLSRLADREAPRAVAAGRIRLGAVSVCPAAGAASCPLVPALSPFSGCCRSWAPPLLPSVRLSLGLSSKEPTSCRDPQDAAKSMGLLPFKTGLLPLCQA